MKSHGDARLYIQYPVWIATLWFTPGSWFSNAMVNGVLAGTAKQSVENLVSLALKPSAVPVGAQEGDPTARGVPRQPATDARSSNPATRTVARTAFILTDVSGPWAASLLFSAAHTAAPWSSQPRGREMKRAVRTSA